MDNSILKEHKIKFICIGRVNENALELKRDVEVEVGKKGDKKKVKTQQITGKVSIDTDHGIVTFFPTFNEVNWDGSGTDNRWTMAQAMLNWNPKIKGDSSIEPTKVNIGGTLNYYDGCAKDSSQVVLKKTYRVESASTRIPTDPETGKEMDCCFSFEGDFYVKSVMTDDETGEGKLKLYYSNYKGEILPVDCTVDAEDANYVFEVEDDEWTPIRPQQTRFLKIAYFKLPDETVVTEEPVPMKRFGAKYGAVADVPTRTKFKEVYVLVSASEHPVEKPEEDEDGNSVWYNPEVIANAEKVRTQKLEELAKNPPKKAGGAANNVANNLKQAKAFGNKTSQYASVAPSAPDDDDFDTMPF